MLQWKREINAFSQTFLTNLTFSITCVCCVSSIRTYIQVDVSSKCIWLYLYIYVVHSNICIIHIPFADKNRRTGSFRSEDSNRNRSIVAKIRIWGPRLLSTKLAICHSISHEMEARFRLRRKISMSRRNFQVRSRLSREFRFSVTEWIFGRCIRLIGTSLRWSASRYNMKFESQFCYNHSRVIQQSRLIL